MQALGNERKQTGKYTTNAVTEGHKRCMHKVYWRHEGELNGFCLDLSWENTNEFPDRQRRKGNCRQRGLSSKEMLYLLIFFKFSMSCLCSLH